MYKQLAGKFVFESLDQTFEKLVRTKLVAGIETAFQQEFQSGEIVTEADIFTVSDGRGHVTAHAGGTNQLITGDVKTLAALFQIVRQMDELGVRFFHEYLF